MALRQERRARADTSSARDGEPVVVHDAKGTGVTPVLVVVGVLALLFVIFLAQSTDDVPVEFLVWEGEPPLYVVLLVTMAVTALATLAIAGVWRRRRLRHRVEREELARLRADRG